MARDTNPDGVGPRSLPLAWFCLLTLLVLLGAMTGLEIRSLLDFARMDVGIYYDAALALRTGGDLYGAYAQAPLTYIYPPFFAILFMPLTHLPLEQAAVIWLLANLLLLLGCLWLGGRLLIDRFDGRLDAATLPVVCLLSVLCFLPRIDAEFDQGQVDFLVLFGVLGGLALIRRHPILAGVILGVIANVKYQTVIFVPYFLLRGWISSAAGFLAGAVGAALSGALVIGWAANLDCLRRGFSGLGTLVGLPEAEGTQPFIFPIQWSESVSLTSTFARWTDAATEGETMTFVLVGLAALLCFAIGWALHAGRGIALFRGRWGARSRTSAEDAPLVILEWLGLMVAALAFSPQTKMRHLGLLLFLAMAAVFLLVVPKPRVSRWPLLVALVVALLAMTLPPQFDEDWRALRKSLRAQGLPIWSLLGLYFTVLWTGLGWVASNRRQDASGAG